MTVVECAQRIMTNNWEGIRDIDIKTLEHGLMMVEAFKNSK
jgi:hypothetical protein